MDLALVTRQTPTVCCFTFILCLCNDNCQEQAEWCTCSRHNILTRRCIGQNQQVGLVFDSYVRALDILSIALSHWGLGDPVLGQVPSRQHHILMQAIL